LPYEDKEGNQRSRFCDADWARSLVDRHPTILDIVFHLREYYFLEK